MKIVKSIKEENGQERREFSQFSNGLNEMKREREKQLEEKMNQEHRKLKAFLLKNYPEYQAILFVSSLPGEGSTSIAIRLAKEFLTEEDRKIILIDANLRNPELHKKLGIEQEKGLIDIINETIFSQAQKFLCERLSTELHQQKERFIQEKGIDYPRNEKEAEFMKKIEKDFETSIGHYIKKTKYKNLMAISSGSIKDNHVSFSENSNIKRLLKFLKKRFDYIFLDGAPANSYTDSLLIAPHVDGILLIVEAERTRREIIARVKEGFENIHSNIIGVVLNKQRYYVPESVYKLI